MTWTCDDLQLLALIDGAGWPEQPPHHYYSSRLFAVSGNPRNAAFRDMSSYPDIPLSDIYKSSVPLYYGFNVLAVNERLYQYLSTSTLYPFTADLNVFPDFHLNAVKLIYSPDNGQTWHNQDGSTPVVRESHEDQPGRMVFFEESQGAFSLLSFLQMGQAYRENRDGYVYVYSPNGITDGTMNELVMFRVPRNQILDREAYEFFNGLTSNGRAKWTRDIGARAVVHTFPRGWVHGSYSFSWSPSVVYNAPLGVYMMVNASSVDPAGTKPGDKPGYMGIWIADTPWGPWRQVHEETPWTPGGDTAAFAGAPLIAPRWVAKDGHSFWLTWNDASLKNQGHEAVSERALIKSMRSTCDRESFQGRLRWRKYHPGWSFNTQRVDLVVR